ncbi:MAG: alanine--tRNA ligase [Candidatus Bipolaricaulota bacterium]|nr:alanine--tRNA ligase [Candidatus Bipolaricaulota bacterium]
MNKFTWREVHRLFLEFFEKKGHAVLPSSSLVPTDDPTLLFTNAGMVQFKNAFLGLEKRPYTRAATIQKCMRVSGKHNDIEQVGPSPRHHSFFLMLGNFSFGDYFKEEAIRFAWEFLTSVLKMPGDRFHFTVYKDDKESADLWRKVSGAPTEKIHHMGEETNFWMMGDIGPCGPNTELIWDRGPEYCTCGKENCSPGLDNDCDRWWEVWNLVFMQYEQLNDGSRRRLLNPGVDTGMGFERLVAILQDANTNYDTDLFLPLMERIRKRCPARELDISQQEKLVAYRVLADHARAIAFLLADNVIPGNEGKSYVLRMIMRRAIRFEKRLGLESRFLGELTQAVIDLMGDYYGELIERRDFILRATQQEEERFERTLSEGEARLEQFIADLKRAGKKVLPGVDAFRLYDTYGFPLEMTEEIAAEQGIGIDKDGFQKEMARQRKRSRTSSLKADIVSVRGGGEDPTQFVGYEKIEAEGHIQGIYSEDHAETELIFDKTPFYAEAGGQTADTGRIENIDQPGRARVLDVQKDSQGAFIHRVRIAAGAFDRGDQCRLIVDAARRRQIARNHTATHLLHKVLRQVLGGHVIQAGSYVSAEELRFDFSHFEKLTAEELLKVEDLVNSVVLQDLPVKTEQMPLAEAKASGATAHFEQEYRGKALVRVVSVGEYSRELCGGTHVNRSGEIGVIKLVSEEAVAAGTRRIRAVTGEGAIRSWRTTEGLLNQLREELGDEPLAGLNRLHAELDDLHSRVGQMTEEILSSKRDELLAHGERIGAVAIVSGRFDMEIEQIKRLADLTEERVHPAVVLLAGEIAGSGIIICKVSKDIAAVDAKSIVRTAAAPLGGSGGGNRHFAQGGGGNVEELNQALRAGVDSVRSLLINADRGDD